MLWTTMDGYNQSSAMRTTGSIELVRMIADYEERKNALLADGYCLRHETIFSDGAMCRLHHMSNGNDIILYARKRLLQQKTNKIVTHEQRY